MSKIIPTERLHEIVQQDSWSEHNKMARELVDRREGGSVAIHQTVWLLCFTDCHDHEPYNTEVHATLEGAKAQRREGWSEWESSNDGEDETSLWSKHPKDCGTYMEITEGTLES